MRKSLFFILLALHLSLSVWAEEPIILSGDARVSLLSCTPGRPSYLHYGHSALRICDPAQNLDWAFNYGLFSFSTDNFYFKFVAGETDYLLGIQYYQDFVADCEWNSRRVYEQVLALDSIQRQQVMDALMENYRPENRVYRYNFVFDNCATRPWKILCQVLGDALDTSDLDDPSGITYRDNISYYSNTLSWMDFGINLAFGASANREMTIAESLFLPENLMNYVETAHFASGEPLCTRSNVQPFVPSDASWKVSPQFIISVLILLLVVLASLSRKKHTLYWPVHAIFFLIYGIAGVILVYLRFFSVHPFVDTNWNVLLLNPLWFVLFGMTCTRRGRRTLSRIWQLFTMVVLLIYALIVLMQGIHLFNIFILVHTALIFLSMVRLPELPRASRKAMVALLCLILPAVAAHAQKLKVVVAVDGLNSEMLSALRPYWSQGGLRTLSEESYQTEITYPHLVYGGTETLATLMTGTVPADHGLSADTYFHRTFRLPMSTLQDGSQSGIGTSERLSPVALLSPTVTDRFRMKEGAAAKIYAVGLSPLSVVTMAGHAADGCCWLEASPTPHWATSTYYSDGLPSAADQINTSDHLMEQALRQWTPRLDIDMYMCPTDQEKKKGFVYDQLKHLLHSPVANTMVIDLALALQRQNHMGEGATRDLLLLQLNLISPKATSDIIYSAEQEDMYLWLNQDLGYLMEQLTKRLGSAGYEIVVVGKPTLGTSAQALELANMTTKSFNVDRAAALINTYLMAVYGHERWVDGGYMNSIFLNRTLIEQKHLSLSDMQREVAAFLLDFEGVRTAFPSTDLHLLPAEGEYGKLRNTLTKRTAGDVCFLLEPCWSILSSDNQVFDMLIDADPASPVLYWSPARRSFPEIHSALDLPQLILK